LRPAPGRRPGGSLPCPGGSEGRQDPTNRPSLVPSSVSTRPQAFKVQNFCQNSKLMSQPIQRFQQLRSSLIRGNLPRFMSNSSRIVSDSARENRDSQIGVFQTMEVAV
jgi:hypothetical protein